MSFVAPLWLAAAAAVGVGVVIAHLFSTSVPPRDFLPTTRFIPEGAPLAVLRTRRVSDVGLLLLRLLAVALLGFALAGAHVRHEGPPRIVVADVSRAVGSIAEVRDSVRSLLSGGGVLVAFDSAAGRLTRDSLEALAASTARGSLSAGIVAAHRAMANVSGNREGTELVLVSPVVREEVDSATSRLLALWKGPVRVARVGAASAPPPLRATVRATGDDPLSVVIPRSEATRNPHVRVVRTSPTRADTAWARDSGGVLVLWPVNGTNVLTRRAAADSQGGIASGRDVVVASFARDYQPREGRVLIRWLDGAPAATEMALGRGCVREVAIPVDAVGDVALRGSFRGIAGSLLEPCGGARDFRPAVIPRSEATRDLQSRSQMRFARNDRTAQDNGLAIWLALAALAALIAEQMLRARSRAAA